MDGKTSKIKNMTEPLAKKAMGVYLYGSYAEGEAHAKSDVDICVVAAEKRNELYRDTNLLMAKHQMLDIKLFEELPISLKRGVMEKGVLLHSKDRKELEMYLRFYKQLWNEQAAVRLGYAKAIA